MLKKHIYSYMWNVTLNWDFRFPFAEAQQPRERNKSVNLLRHCCVFVIHKATYRR